MSSVREIALEFLSRGGKQLRPRLCRIVYEALAGGGPCAGDLEKVLGAVECFHKASLVHDDIQDGDAERYGRPTVHAAHGVPVAVAVGDWLVAEGYRRLATSGFPRAAEMLCAAASSHLQLSEGQGDELLLRGVRPTEDETLSIYRRKTGEAFALAARLGALAARESDTAEVERGLMRFGIAFGVLFQMRDDAEDREASLPTAARDLMLEECRAALARLPAEVSRAVAAWSESFFPSGHLR